MWSEPTCIPLQGSPICKKGIPKMGYADEVFCAALAKNYKELVAKREAEKVPAEEGRGGSEDSAYLSIRTLWDPTLLSQHTSMGHETDLSTPSRDATVSAKPTETASNNDSDSEGDSEGGSVCSADSMATDWVDLGGIGF